MATEDSPNLIGLLFLAIRETNPYIHASLSCELLMLPILPLRIEKGNL